MRRRRFLISMVAGLLGLTIADPALAGKKSEECMPSYNPILLDRNFTPLTIENTAAEQTLYSFTLSAHSLGTSRAARLRLTGEYHNSSGALETFIIRVYYGSTEMWESAGHLVSSSAKRWLFNFDLLLNARDAIDEQLFTGIVTPVATMARGLAFENADTDLDFKVTVQLSVAHANFEIVRESAILEIV